MSGYSKLGRAIMRAKSLSPVVSQSRIKVQPRKPKPMDHTQALDDICDRLATIEAKLVAKGLARHEENEAIAQMADQASEQWIKHGVEYAVGQGNPFPAFAKAIRERVK